MALKVQKRVVTSERCCGNKHSYNGALWHQGALVFPQFYYLILSLKKKCAYTRRLADMSNA